ncbi:MAG: nucleotidyltransferase domain-containing protein [Acidobacteria bacterium]|nr:nucleotidyltransferase domain-containing protein [Acidobacteriota bacterium]
MNGNGHEEKAKPDARKDPEGSTRARSHQKRGSDVDFLVDLERPTYDNFIDLNFSLERLFRRKVGLVTSRSLNPRIKPFVENEVAWHEVR